MKKMNYTKIIISFPRVWVGEISKINKKVIEKKNFWVKIKLAQSPLIIK